ncbi:MurR/RpiR family transcriptional regulator [Aerococcus agrisoli]|uniref:MurR/RpiR family transcriptional regulator n=1 Tax=Aerococcus agrisoli TaxID=2487350 RepID=A0A3N4GNV0_9LACT|nr:MurR/RpiR family transcriptional regulator [Aerococcus agrisoli]RPA60801.1 MurR/RpiR family transcriptional regulator [Aerococcus agrisoli]
MEELFHIDYQDLTESEQKIVNYFNVNQAMAPLLSITEVSKAIGISNATLSRFCRKLGFKNFKELKLALVASQDVTPASKLQNALQMKQQKDLVEEMPFVTQRLYRDIDQILQTIEQLDDEQFSKAAEMITQKKRIFVFSKGASKSLGHLLSFRLKRFGINIQHIGLGGSEIFETLHNVGSDDLLVLFFFGKSPRETQVVFDYATSMNIDTICFSDQLYRNPGNIGTFQFYVSRGVPTEYHSLTSAMSLIDALVVEVSRIGPSSYHDHLRKMHSLKEQYKKDIPR